MDLKQQLESADKYSQEIQRTESITSSKQIDERDAQIQNLMKQIEDMCIQDTANKQLIEKQREDNDTWQKKYKKMYRDIKSEQIIEEKKRYELYIKVKEQNSILKQTKRDLRDKEKQLDILKHEHAVALSKK